DCPGDLFSIECTPTSKIPRGWGCRIATLHLAYVARQSDLGNPLPLRPSFFFEVVVLIKRMLKVALHQRCFSVTIKGYH
ncbi:MAG: hypothetical protein WCH04_19610, partial [Gammaproteobacteria bacterium]